MLRSLVSLPLLLTALSLAPADDPPQEAPDPLVATRVEGVAPLAFPLGGETSELLIPRDEHLTYGVHVAVGPVGATVGKVYLDTGVEPYRESVVLLGGGGKSDREVGRLAAKAEGSYLFYSMVTTLDSRYLPQTWPNISHFYRQTGSENRRRETQLGTVEGVPTASYRSDTKHGAPAGQRIWGGSSDRELPAGTVDMLGAVYLARSLVITDAEELVFPLVDKLALWEMHLSLGDESRIEVPAGTFDVVEVKLEPQVWPGEPERAASKFRGLFGIRGSIQLFVDRTTGVPVRIAGTIPAGPVNVECDIFLELSTGTPDAFGPLDLEVEAEAEAEE